MILSAQTIEERWYAAHERAKEDPILLPFFRRTQQTYNSAINHPPSLSFGLSPAGYDIRIDRGLVIPAKGFALASSLERFNMPSDLLARVADKSTWARWGLAVQNTVIEPGWRGYLTLELTNHSERDIHILDGDPIAQILFETLDKPTIQLYEGKYQDQKKGPVQGL